MIRTLKPLVLATFAGLLILGAAGLSIQPVMAAGYDVQAPARVVHVPDGDTLTVRRWPASWSRAVGALDRGVRVFVVRCIIAPQGGADWCLLTGPAQRGWVNRRYLRFLSP